VGSGLGRARFDEQDGEERRCEQGQSANAVDPYHRNLSEMRRMRCALFQLWSGGIISLVRLCGYGFVCVRSAEATGRQEPGFRYTLGETFGTLPLLRGEVRPVIHTDN
jgi:hypothetical protein